MDSYGMGHRKEVEKPKTKTELKTMMKLEARSHANTCEELAAKVRGFDGRTDTPVTIALDQAARFLRRLTV
jgi:hypothetical protein